MEHRDGGKFKGTHTTFIDLAATAADIIAKIETVSGISAGLIQMGKGVSGGMRKVKIGDFKGGIVLTVRQSRSVQEVRVYSADISATRLAIARALRDNDIAIAFRHD